MRSKTIWPANFPFLLSIIKLLRFHMNLPGKGFPGAGLPDFYEIQHRVAVLSQERNQAIVVGMHIVVDGFLSIGCRQLFRLRKQRRSNAPSSARLLQINVA